MKTVCVFGADGRTGIEVVKQALRDGYSVIACVYNESARSTMPQEAESIVVDVLSIDDVRRAFKNADAVISVIGHIKDSDPLMQTKGITHITKVMTELGISRIISLTGSGVREAGDTITLLDKIGNFLISIIDKERVNDGILHAKVLKKSNLDWTIVRVLKLDSRINQNTEYTLTEHGPVAPLTSRNVVARILVDMIDDTAWIHKTPLVS